MPNVLIVSPVSDVAGGGIGLKYAFDAVGGAWTARHVRGGSEWLDYPHDAEWSQLDGLWQWADLVHVMELPRYVLGQLPRKPMVVYHTGSRYRRDPEQMEHLCRQLGAVQLAGSLDLCRLKGHPWLPIVADLDALAGYSRVGAGSDANASNGDDNGSYPSNGPQSPCQGSARVMSDGSGNGRRLRISHAPTNRALKSTDVILETLADLDVDVDLIEGVSNAECIARKAATDIYVDELTLGYGMNALECWALGIPVVSGIADPWFRTEALRWWGELPFAEATPETLSNVLARLVASPELRTEYVARGQAFAQRWHSQRAVVTQLEGVYLRTMAVWNRRQRLTGRAIHSATQ